MIKLLKINVFYPNFVGLYDIDKSSFGAIGKPLASLVDNFCQRPADPTSIMPRNVTSTPLGVIVDSRCAATRGVGTGIASTPLRTRAHHSRHNVDGVLDPTVASLRLSESQASAPKLMSPAWPRLCRVRSFTFAIPMGNRRRCLHLLSQSYCRRSCSSWFNLSWPKRFCPGSVGRRVYGQSVWCSSR